MTRWFIHIVISAVLLTSCCAYKEFESMESVPENLFGELICEVRDTASLASLDWKVFFKDKELQALIDTALVRNTDYRVAQLRTQQALASLGAARLAYFPTLNLDAEGNVSRYDGLTSRTYTVGLNASWEIDIFGKLTAVKRGAIASAASAEEEAQAVRTQLIATVANLYYSLLMLDRQLEIARATLENWTETINVMEILKTAGMAKETGILQAKANWVSLQADISTMMKNQREIENSLCGVLAVPSGNIARGNLDNTFFPDSLSIGLPIQLLANRPDVRAAEMELARTHYAVGEARASFYPSLTLAGAVGFTNNGNIVVNPGQWLLNVVGQIVQPIFNRGRLKANYRIAETEREIAKLRFNQTLLNAGMEVNNFLSEIFSARERLAMAKEQIKLLDDAVKKTELLMRHSSTNYLEVLIAQQSHLSARQVEVQCRFDEIAGIINLYCALGGGIK